jgi:hypothetical protein
MPRTRLIAVFAVACRNLDVAAAIAIPTAAWVNFLWDELAHVRAGCSNRSSYERNGASSPVCVVLRPPPRSGGKGSENSEYCSQ